MVVIGQMAAAILALTSVLALACFAKAFGISFLAMPRSSHARHAEEVPLPMRIGMGGLAAACAFLGLAPMVVVPLLDDGRVVVERQFCYPVGLHMIEFPAGKLDAGEDPLLCGQR